MKNKLSMHTTKMFLPSWWIAAFDQIVSQIDPSEYLGLSKNLKVLPLFDSAELSSIALISSKFQQSLLEGDGITKIDADYVEKHISNGKNNVVQSKILQLFGGIRYLNDSSALPIIAWEKVYDEKGKSAPTIEFKLTFEGDELILGVTNAYSETNRIFENNFTLNSILRKRPPIGVGKSLWLDLNSVESALLLRMEVAMQWDQKWLHFNGSFGTGMTDLFDGLEIKLRKNVPSEFSKKIRVLDRLGKKLVEHGVVSQPEPQNYMAFESLNDTQLIWKLSNDSTNWEDGNVYFKNCASYFQKRNFLETKVSVPKFLNKVFGEELSQHIVELNKLGEKIISNEDSELISVVGGNSVVTKFGLFCEVYLRANSNLSLSFSEELLGNFTITEDVLSSWKNFEDEIAALSGRLEQIIEDFSLAGQKYLSSLAESEVQAITQRIARKSEPSPVATKKGKITIKKDHSTSIGNEDFPEKPGNTKAKELTTHGLGSKFRKIASDELERLKRHQPTEYLKIQQKYFESMTEKQRKTWDQVTSRVRPELREQQLRLMLIRFMVDNPNLWETKASASSDTNK